MTTPIALDNLPLFALASSHAVNASTFVMASGSGAIIAAQATKQGVSIGSGNPIYFQALPASSVTNGVPTSAAGAVAFTATGLSGDTLTGVSVLYSGATDPGFATGDSIAFGVISGYFNGVSSAVATNAAAITSQGASISSINTALALKAPLASPSLTGTPTAPTATVGTNTTQLATCAFVLANAPTAPVSWISLKNDVGIPDDCTVSPTAFGSPSFSDSAYGTLTLASGPYAGQTVTQAIQATLDKAAAGPLAILWDVRCSVGVQAHGPATETAQALLFRRPGNLLIQGVSGGSVTLRAQSNAAVFANELPTFGTFASGAGATTVNTLGGIAFGNLTIRDLIVNANSGVVTNPGGEGSFAVNQLNPPLLTSYCLNAFQLFGVKNILFERCQFYGAGGFQTWFGNFQSIAFLNGIIDAANTAANGNDCLHMNGPGDDFVVRDSRFSCGDDYLAINATGDGNGATLTPPTIPYWGAITNVKAYNCTSIRNFGISNFVRIAGNPSGSPENHYFSGLRGPIATVAILAQLPVVQASFEDINCDFAGSGSAGFRIASNVNRCSLKRINRIGSNLATPLANIGAAVGVLDVSDLWVYDDTTSGTDKQQIEVASGATVSLLRATNVALQSADAGQANMPLLQVDAGGTVSALDVQGIESSHVANLVVNQGTITSSMVRGAIMTSGTAIAANSGTWRTAVLSNADPNTVDFTGSAPTFRTGDYYNLPTTIPATMTVFPAIVEGSTSGTLTITGSQTNWTSGTTFTLPTISGVSWGTPAVNSSAQTATVTFSATSGATGSGSITNSADASTATIACVAASKVFLNDTFTGTNGTLLSVHTPNTPNGSDAWSNDAFGDFALTGSGGATSTGAAVSSLWAALYPLTGVTEAVVITTVFEFTAGATGSFFFQFRKQDGSNFLNFNAALSGTIAAYAFIGGNVAANYLSGSFAWVAGTPYTLKITYNPVGGAITFAINGSVVATGTAAYAAIENGTSMLLLQSGGAAGDLTITSAKVSVS